MLKSIKMKIKRITRTIFTLGMSLMIGLFVVSDIQRREHQSIGSQKYYGNLSFSIKLPSRELWSTDEECNKYRIQHLTKRPVCALASYPGSGNTWVRYLIEGATGVFTGSRYADLQMQMSGMWGEIRNWRDGTTIVQKTHDSHPNHVRNDFNGRGILLLRNPYDSVLSNHNFMFGGHTGRAPDESSNKTGWERFVAIEVAEWTILALNWTLSSTPDKLLIIHYEQVKKDIKCEMEKILSFLEIPVDDKRITCLLKHSNGYFHRKSKKKQNKLLFSAKLRTQVDLVINLLHKVIEYRGYEGLPLSEYKFYNKTSSEILDSLSLENYNKEVSSELIEEDSLNEIDKQVGTKLIYDMVKKLLKKAPTDDTKTKMIKFMLDGLINNMDKVIKTKGESVDSLEDLVDKMKTIL